MRWLVIIASLISGPADAAFRWPWEVRHPTRQCQHQATPGAAVSCDDILAAVKMLDPPHPASALKSSTENQKRTISKCMAKEGVNK